MKNKLNPLIITPARVRKEPTPFLTCIYISISTLKNQLFFKHTSKSKYDYIIIFVSIELQNNILLEYVLGKMVKLLLKKTNISFSII